MEKYPYSQGVLEEVLKNENDPAWNPPLRAGEPAGFVGVEDEQMALREADEPIPEKLLQGDAEELKFEKLNNKVEGEDVPYSETLTPPDPDVSPNGDEKYRGYVFPLEDKDKDHLYGGAEADEKMPLWFFVGGIHQSVAEEWYYDKSMHYGQADCIGVARLCAQRYYRNRNAMYKNVKGTVSDIVADCIGEMHVIDPNNLDEIPVGAVLFRESKEGHMGYYLGEFDGKKHCIAETNHDKDNMHYDSLEDRYRKNKDEGFYYWALLDCVDYTTDYFKDGSWLVVDDEPQALPAWEEWNPQKA